ncbi:hypothetical protein V6Z11_A03G052400 [Gossypium hirsutum]
MRVFSTESIDIPFQTLRMSSSRFHFSLVLSPYPFLLSFLQIQGRFLPGKIPSYSSMFQLLKYVLDCFPLEGCIQTCISCILPVAVEYHECKHLSETYLGFSPCTF